MRLSHSLIFAGALFVAAPALADDPSNYAVVETNAATNTTTTAIDQNAISNQAASPTDNTTVAPAPTHRSFPWGVLGLLGLVGLLGVRKAKS